MALPRIPRLLPLPNQGQDEFLSFLRLGNELSLYLRIPEAPAISPMPGGRRTKDFFLITLVMARAVATLLQVRNTCGTILQVCSQHKDSYLLRPFLHSNRPRPSEKHNIRSINRAGISLFLRLRKPPISCVHRKRQGSYFRSQSIPIRLIALLLKKRRPGHLVSKFLGVNPFFWRNRMFRLSSGMLPIKSRPSLFRFLYLES